MTDQGLVLNVLNIPRPEIEHNPSSPEVLLGAIGMLAEAAVKDGRIHLLELAIEGYAHDPRELFEIAGVCEWARKAFREAPGVWYFLSKPSQWRFVGWLCGPAGKSEVETPAFQECFDNQRMETVTKGIAYGEELLLKHGADKRLLEHFRAYHSASQPGDANS